MSDKILIRKDSRVQFISMPVCILLVGCIIISFILQFMGAYRIFGFAFLFVIFCILLIKIIYIFSYDLKFTNTTYEYVIFDSIKFIVILIALMVFGKQCYDFIFAEKINQSITVTSVTSDYTFINYNMKVKTVDNGEFYFSSPMKYLNLLSNEVVTNSVFNIEYIEFHGKNVITKMDRQLAP